MIELQPSNTRNWRMDGAPIIFLGGAIDNGQAEEWQKKVVSELSAYHVTILNPRRNNWDPSWANDSPEFLQQVGWEQDGLEEADIALFVFASNTDEAKKVKAPITLMELGQHIKEKKCFVCCPPGFWRKGNVDFVCKRNNVPVYEDLGSMVAALKQFLVDEYWYVTPD